MARSLDRKPISLALLGIVVFVGFLAGSVATLTIESSTDSSTKAHRVLESAPTSTTVAVATPITRAPRKAKPYDVLLRASLQSVASYWQTVMPDVYDTSYKRLSGGIYAYSADSTIPPCGGFALPYVFLQQNAFYCPDSDFIAWDDQGLFPRLEKRYGLFLLSIVLAHEWGHAIQERAGSLLYGVALEQQADCFAGSWAASLRVETDPELTALRDRELDRSLAGFVEFRDRLGMTGNDLGAHGTAFDRIRAFQDGYDGGANACADYEDEVPTLIAIPYRSFKERFRGGNLPYDQVVKTLSMRIDLFWKDELGSQAKPALKRSSDLAFCSALPLSPEGFGDSELSWCADNNVTSYDDNAMRKLYNDIGDFAVGTELALQRALAHQASQGIDPRDKKVWLRAVCQVGAWSGSMFEPDEPEASLLSPGDIDEAVRTILEYATKGDATRFGTGFEQVAAFRTGVLGSIDSCGSIPVP